MSRQPGSIHAKICMLGNGSVGKSALTLQFMYNEFVADYEPTKCVAFNKSFHLDGMPVEVDIMDTAGQEDYAGVRDQYYRHNEAFLAVFSITDKDSFNNIPYILDSIMTCRGSDTTPVVLVGNKVDLQDERQVPKEEAIQLARERHLQYIETSAKTTINVIEAYEMLIREVVQRKLQNQRVSAAPQEASEKKCCCTML